MLQTQQQTLNKKIEAIKSKQVENQTGVDTEGKTINDAASQTNKIDDTKESREKRFRKKHLRRTAREIDRSFICPYDTCAKVYGSEGSLNLHIKIKHNGGNKTDREKLAKSLVAAHLNGDF